LQILIEGVQASGSRKHSFRAPRFGVRGVFYLQKRFALSMKRPTKRGGEKGLTRTMRKGVKLIKVCLRSQRFSLEPGI